MPATDTQPSGSATGLRVALFSGNYNYVREGANNALNRLVGHLLDEGAAVRVYSPTTRTPAFEPVGDLVSVPSIALPVRSEFRMAFGLPEKLRRDVRAFGPNLIHVSTPDLLGTASIGLARAMNVPVFASLHTLFETYLEHYGLSWLTNWAWRRQRDFYRSVDLVLAPNVPMVAHLKRMGIGEERIRIWGRGIDHNQFAPGLRDEDWRRANGFSPDEVVICFFGRTVREKGTACFARTIAELRSRGHSVRPLVIGGGPASDEFRDALGPAKFVGHLDGRDLGRVLASADVMLNPSVTEAFGNVTLEAMAAGLAVVSADAPSATAIIEDGVTGLLREPEPQAFADAIEYLLANPDELVGMRKAASAVARRVNWPAINASAVRAYRELV